MNSIHILQTSCRLKNYRESKNFTDSEIKKQSEPVLETEMQFLLYTLASLMSGAVYSFKNINIRVLI